MQFYYTNKIKEQNKTKLKTPFLYLKLFPLVPCIPGFYGCAQQYQNLTEY